jgi:hypothetical protein
MEARQTKGRLRRLVTPEQSTFLSAVVHANMRSFGAMRARLGGVHGGLRHAENCGGDGIWSS